MDKTANIPQLQIIVKNTIEDYQKSLKGEIRTKGLREKLIKRVNTLSIINSLLILHEE